MIFVCVGSRKFQFDRLLKEVDNLVAIGEIKEEVFAQIGASNYNPQNYSFKRYLSSEEFNNYQESSKLIISHGGTGALIGALKKGKQVIAVPRLAKFKEHSDDHQLQISNELFNEGFLVQVNDIEELLAAINSLKNNPITKKYTKESSIVPIIENFIEKTK